MCNLICVTNFLRNVKPVYCDHILQNSPLILVVCGHVSLHVELCGLCSSNVQVGHSESDCVCVWVVSVMFHRHGVECECVRT